MQHRRAPAGFDRLSGGTLFHRGGFYSRSSFPRFFGGVLRGVPAPLCAPAPACPAPPRFEPPPPCCDSAPLRFAMRLSLFLIFVMRCRGASGGGHPLLAIESGR